MNEIRYLSSSLTSIWIRSCLIHICPVKPAPLSVLRPQLVCLDLSNCGFQDQPALLNGLSTLPCLRTLLLEGNPFTLASSYSGLTVDSLPQLSCLDTSWISPEERIRFRGLAKMSGECVSCPMSPVSEGPRFLYNFNAH